MDDDVFERAVGFVIEQIEKCEVIESMEFGGIDYDYILAAMDTPSSRLMNGSFIIKHDDALRLVQRAKETRGAFVYAAAVCVKNIEANQRMPIPLKEFAFDVLEVKFPIPPVSARNRRWARNFFIVSTIDTVSKKFKLRRSRNDETEKTRSSIDAVRIGMERKGAHITFDTLKGLAMRKDSLTAKELKAYEMILENVGRKEFILRLPGTDPADPPWADTSTCEF